MSEYLALVVVAVLAFFVPLITNRLKIPIVVGEITIGIFIGILTVELNSYFGITVLDFSGAIQFLATIGFVFLMFLAGLEIDFDQIEDRGHTPILMGLILFVFTLVLAFGFSYMLGFGFYMALILSTTSVGVVVPVIKEMGISKTELGQTILISSLIADFATMVLITLYAAYFRSISAPSFLYISILFFILIFVLFFGLYKLLNTMMWSHPRFMDKFFRTDDPAELGVRASLALVFAFVAFAEFFGVEIVLAAFLAGAMMSLIFRDIAALEKKLYGIGYGFLIPVFFIITGTRLDVTVFFDPRMLILVPMLIAVAYIVKVVPSLVLHLNLSLKQRISSGVLMAARLSLVIAAVEIGKSLGVIDVTMESTMILVIVVTCVISPIVFKYIEGRKT
jgi:CPA2 family monovalent cation:H+ antiporter-2